MQYVKDLKNHETKCDRIQGLKKLVTVGFRTPWPIKVITHQGFKDYKKRGGLSAELKKQIEAAFVEIREQNPTRGVYAGRAYYVPGLNNPPGPRSSSVRDLKVLFGEVEKLYTFAINSKYDQKNDSEVGVIFYPFINAGDPLPDEQHPDLQYPGGCVTPRGESEGVVEALFGADEGVQSFAFDTYVVDLKNNLIKSKDIQHKKQSLKATNDLKYETVVVPVEFRDRQALSDEVIVSIGRDFKKLMDMFGSHRLEFILQPEGVVFRECVVFKEEDQAMISLEERVKVVTNEGDLAKLDKQVKLVFVHPQVIVKRNMDLLTDLAFGVEQKLVVLFPGSATTAHAATLLRERGHEVVYVGQKDFEDDQVVKIEKGVVI